MVMGNTLLKTFDDNCVIIRADIDTVVDSRCLLGTIDVHINSAR